MCVIALGLGLIDASETECAFSFFVEQLLHVCVCQTVIHFAEIRTNRYDIGVTHLQFCFSFSLVHFQQNDCTAWLHAPEIALSYAPRDSG